jgi:plasmid stabilization system protein ParE
MAFKVMWSPVAVQTFDEIVEYTKTNWTDKEVQELVRTVNRKVLLLSQFPFLFPSTSSGQQRRKTLIHKRIILIYKVRKRKKEIELLRFWNTWQSKR